jgi:hypothetical protein
MQCDIGAKGSLMADSGGFVLMTKQDGMSGA